MIKFTIFTLACLCCTIGFTKGTITKTELKGVNKYIDGVFQIFVYNLLDEGLCNLKMRNFNAPINQTMYGDAVVGDLKYFNGFVLGADDLSVKTDSIKATLDEYSMLAYITSFVIFDKLRFSYDMQAQLMPNITQNATGIFEMDSNELTMTITKDLKTGIVTSSLKSTGNAKSQRIDFQPKNYYTTIIAREFSAGHADVEGSFTDFTNGLLSDILNQIVVEEVSFPEIDYDTYDSPKSRKKSASKLSKSRG